MYVPESYVHLSPAYICVHATVKSFASPTAAIFSIVALCPFMILVSQMQREEKTIQSYIMKIREMTSPSV